MYTRYADDLTFSCNNKLTLKKLKKIIEEIIEEEGFELNPKKSRLLSPASHKIITGLTVNNAEVKASKKLKRKVRAMIHHSILTENYSNNQKIVGYISYINSIENDYLNKIKSYIQDLISKDYNKYKNVVDAFNSNKLYKDLEDMVYNDYHENRVSGHFEYESYEYESYELYNDSIDFLSMQREFLIEKGYLREPEKQSEIDEVDTRLFNGDINDF